MGVFGGPEKDQDFCSGKPVLVHYVVATVLAVLVVSTGATLVVSTLCRPSCFSTLGGIPAPVVFNTDNFPHLVCCPLHPTVGGSDSRLLL